MEEKDDHILANHEPELLDKDVVKDLYSCLKF